MKKTKIRIKNKWKKPIIVVLSAIVLIGLIYFVIYRIKLQIDLKSQEMPQSHYYNYKIATSNYVSDVYRGEVPSNKISNKIEMIFQVHLPEAYQNVINKTDEEIKAYYRSDKESIQSLTGISDEDEYVQFIRDALKVGCDLKNYSLITYKKNSYKRYGAEEIIELEIKYKNNKKLNAVMHIISSHSEIENAYVEFK